MNYSVLIVDDEPLTRSFLAGAIPKACPDFAAVRDAKNGMEALALLQEGAFDLLVTDIRMPQMDGLELAGKARRLYPELPIVILSGHDEFSYAQQAIRHGVRSYLLKPIEADKLAEMLADIKQHLALRREEHFGNLHLRQIAQNYRTSLAEEYLDALLEGNHARQMAAAPLFKQLDMPRFGPGQVILSFGLNGESLVRHAASTADLDTFDFMLYQTLRDLAHEWDGGMAVYFGSGGHRVLLEHGEECAKRFYQTLAGVLRAGTGLEVSCGATGELAGEQQVAACARMADAALLGHLARGAGFYCDVDGREWARPVLSARREVWRFVREHDGAALREALARFCLAAAGHGVSEQAALLWLLVPRSSIPAQAFPGEEAYRAAMEHLLAAVNGGEPPIGRQTAFETLRLLADTTPPAGPEANTPVERAIAFIHDNYQNPISLIDIAEHAGVSPNYLSTLFSRYKNESYIKYLTRIRMEAAARLLREQPDGRVADIAEHCGFYNPKHFFHVFRQTYGASPGEYQRNCRV